MGVLRLLIALSIFLGHFKVFYPISPANDWFPYLQGAAYGGAIKVNSFFIIAGFFIHWMLSEKFSRSKNTVRDFLISRGIRLMPPYFFVLVLTYCVFIFARELELNIYILERAARLESWQGLIANVFLINPYIFKLDNLKYFEVEEYLVVSHAWALSVEVVFLLLAPYLLLSKKSYFFVIATGVSFISALYYVYNYDVVRSYVGSSMIYFLLGALSYKHYARRYSRATFSYRHKISAYIISIVIITYLFCFSLVEIVIGKYFAYTLYVVLFLIALPYIVAATKNSSLDRYIGDLAYPVYLVHFNVIYVCIIAGLNATAALFFSLLVILLYAVFSHNFITTPLITFRTNQLQKKSGSK